MLHITSAAAVAVQEGHVAATNPQVVTNTVVCFVPMFRVAFKLTIQEASKQAMNTKSDCARQ
jgi:hypothetical protein